MDERERPESDAVIARINKALQSSDIKAIFVAVGDAVRPHNVADVAKKAALHRPGIYRAFGDKQNPNFSTVLSVLHAPMIRRPTAEHELSISLRGIERRSATASRDSRTDMASRGPAC
ncbi:MAG: hypothetical protein KGK01_08665 [Bradyrhizobium sp.]|uniref:helix-turn-helix domain-containing transcriptional regulator n=1 Tax=Bradyrhizobium sp. TaxID=376 RepID=UPI0023A2040C|nr:hypothetical protein [Bradyrhizobium sp.]MDE2242497.1 hypothetical protein [Bradyrhizobium sp.]